MILELLPLCRHNQDKNLSTYNCHIFQNIDVVNSLKYSLIISVIVKWFSSYVGFYKISANGWVFLLAGIVITGFCKYN